MQLRSIYITLAVSLIAFGATAQNAYNDSLKKYQQKYKADLFSIIKNDTAYVKFFPVDPDYKVWAQVEILKGQTFFGMKTSGNDPKDAVKYAVITFKLKGKDYKLYAYQLAMLLTNPKYKNDFFIPFTDATSGEETYANGRYLDFSISNISAKNDLVLDFNKAYNPYCAFATGYNCPIPPKENDLPVAIKAGEKAYGKKTH